MKNCNFIPAPYNLNELIRILEDENTTSIKIKIVSSELVKFTIKESLVQMEQTYKIKINDAAIIVAVTSAFDMLDDNGWSMLCDSDLGLQALGNQFESKFEGNIENAERDEWITSIANIITDQLTAIDIDKARKAWRNLKLQSFPKHSAISVRY